MLQAGSRDGLEALGLTRCRILSGTSVTRRWPSLFRLQSTAVAVSAAIILSAPAILPFALHLFEHAGTPDGLCYWFGERQDTA